MQGIEPVLSLVVSVEVKIALLFRLHPAPLSWLKAFDRSWPQGKHRELSAGVIPKMCCTAVQQFQL